MNLNNFDYVKMIKCILQLQKKHTMLETYSVGKSVEGRELFCIKFGCGDKKIFLNGAHHSLEWITASLLMGFSFDFLNSLKKGKKLCGYDTQKIYDDATFYIMPMVNPDGVNVVINGLDEDNEYHRVISEMLSGKKLEKENGIFGAGPTRFSGEEPFSEPETIAVRELFCKEMFNLSIAFHSQGEVIYWDYQNKSKCFDIAKELSCASGYQLDTAGGITAVSGFKDWVIEKYNLPAFTVEVGKGVNPISFSQFKKIKRDNTKLILKAATII